MKEWFNRTFFADEPLGDKILSILIGIFAMLFVCGWAIGILWFIFHSFFEFLKWTKKKDGIPDYDFEDKIDSIEEKIGNVFKLPLKLIPDSVDTFFYNNKAQISFYKSLVVGISIPIVAFLIWLVSSSSPINDFLLIMKSTTAKGHITDAKERTDVVEENDGRTSHLVYFYDYEYNFSLPNGKVIETYGSEPGQLPDYLTDLDEPYQVEVEYLANNPKVSRIKGMDSNDTSILQWIRHRMIIQTIIFLLFCYWGITIIKAGLKKYKNEKSSRCVDVENSA
jgi:hypothetical protein